MRALTSTTIAVAFFAASSMAAADPSRSAPDQARREREAREAEEAGEAVGRATTTAATAVIEAGQDVSRVLDPPGKYNTVAASWNPLGLIIGGRVSFNVELAPIVHHVLIASPHVATTSQDVSLAATSYEKRFTGAGLELGYRYYTGHRGMNGLFIGPSIVGGVYRASLFRTDETFTNIGVAADLGFQHIVLDHIAFGAGIGLEYLRVSKDFGQLATGPSTIATTGFKPRLLAQVGYAF